jgi:hypothetical protein
MSRFRAVLALCLVIAALGCTSHDDSSSATSSTRPPSTTPTSSRATSTTAARPVTTTTAPVTVPVTAIGDSVMIDATPALRAAIPTITVDAEESRSALPGPDLLAGFAAQGRLGAAIVVGLGSNGGMSTRVVDAVLQVAAGRRVVMVTSHCPYCSWTPRGNAVIRATCVETRGCFVADWDAAAQAHPEWFATDGVHMSSGGAGARAYAQLVRAQL